MGQVVIDLPATAAPVRIAHRVAGAAAPRVAPSRDRWPLVLAALALLVYLPGITWGIPDALAPDRTDAWGNDDGVPLAPLAEMHSTFVEAAPDRNIAYPWFHYFLAACAEAPYLVYLWGTGGLTKLEAVYPFGLVDPSGAFRTLSLSGRSISILLAVATVLGAYHTAKNLWNRPAGVIAAIFSMLMFPMAYYARLGNPDVPSLGWTSLALAMFALILRQGLTVKRGTWLAAFAALAVATKTGIGSFVFLPLVLLPQHLRRRRSATFLGWTSIWTAPMVSAAAFILIYVVASGIPIDPMRYAQHTGQGVAAIAGGAPYLSHPATPAGVAVQVTDLLGYLVDVMSWPVVVLALVGLALALQRDPRSLALALPSLGYFAMVVWPRFSRVHYLLPVALPLNAFAAYALARGLGGRRGQRTVTAVAGVVAVTYLALQTVDLTHDMLFDSRYAAAAWLDRHARPDERIVYFTPGQMLPRIPPGVHTQRVESRGLALATIVEQRPEFLLVMPYDINDDRQRVEWRHGPHSIHSGYLPREVHSRLADESLGYQLVAQFQSPRLLPWLPRPFLSYPTVNPPIHVYAQVGRSDGARALRPWDTAPHYPRSIRVRELTVDRLTAETR